MSVKLETKAPKNLSHTHTHFIGALQDALISHTFRKRARIPCVYLCVVAHGDSALIPEPTLGHFAACLGVCGVVLWDETFGSSSVIDHALENDTTPHGSLHPPPRVTSDIQPPSMRAFRQTHNSLPLKMSKGIDHFCLPYFYIYLISMYFCYAVIQRSYRSSSRFSCVLSQSRQQRRGYD